MKSLQIEIYSSYSLVYGVDDINRTLIMSIDSVDFGVIGKVIDKELPEFDCRRLFLVG